MKLFTKILLLLILCNNLIAQEKARLQERKKLLLEEIQFSNKVLEQTKKEKDVSFHQLKTLKHKIAIRSQLIRTIQKEVEYINQEIELNQNEKLRLELELDSLKINYAYLIQQAYKSRKHFNRILFLFSSRDFQQAYKRASYMRQISQQRLSQADVISAKKAQLQKSIMILNKQKSIKQNLIENKQLEYELYNKEQAQEVISLAALSEKEKELKNFLEAKKIQRKKIQKEIELIIADELKKATKTNATIDFGSTPEAKKLSNSFSTNKGGLPWPVSKGVIISKFGKQKHPVLAGVNIENNGIEIATEPQGLCRSIFNGNVSSVLTMPNGTKVVMIRHGEYISVYSNLGEVFIEKGQEVETKENIGIVYTSKQVGSTVIDFQLWKSSQKLNPQLWLMKK
jgi:septal ring factor EnvC (AmiA/AmiB activator)